MDMLIGNLDPDHPADDAAKSKMRVYLGDLCDTFAKLGVKDLVVKSGGTFGIHTDLLDCDYYRYLDGDLGREQAEKKQEETQAQPKKDLSQMSPEELMKEFMDAWEKSSGAPAKKPKCL